MAYIINHTKISFLKNNIIRFEYSPNDNFTNSSTLFVKNKKVSNESYQLEDLVGDLKLINYQDLTLIFDANKPIDTIQIYQGEKVIYKFKSKANTGELPAPNKTPFVFLLNDSPRLILAEEGYNEYGNYIVDKHARDIYLLICRNDFKYLRKQFISLTGHNDMPRIKTFGLFHSRYYPYSEKDVYNIVDKYKKNKIPLDNFVLDTDWRISLDKQGIGYDVNTKLFPDISRLFKNLHAKNIEVVFNDHPLPLNKGKDVFSIEERSYRYTNLTKYLGLGLDIWWYDRNWSASLISPSKRLKKEVLGAYIYHNISEQFYQSFSLDSEVYTRPVTMSNISEITNGQYQYICDSYAHTLAFQWSGDIYAEPRKLKEEIKNMINCANNMLGYYSSDIGGHIGIESKEMFIRWYQYGCFSPILRPHVTFLEEKSREPWAYDSETLDTIREYIYMRYRLLNVFYTSAYKHYLDGLGIVKPLSFYDTKDNKCLNNYSSYLIDDKILVSPITNSQMCEIKDDNIIGQIKLTYFDNSGKRPKKIKEFKTNSFLELGNIKIDDSLKENVSITHEMKLKFKHDVDLYYQLDNPSYKSKLYIDGRLALKQSENKTGFNFAKTLKKDKQYEIIFDTPYLDEGINNIVYTINDKNKKENIYLPRGEWFDVAHQNVYQGHRFVKKAYNDKQMPLFVKAGTLLALYSKVDNISNMSLKDICYDFYPSKIEFTKDYFYEDDGVSTAYRVGVYRLNPYELSFKDNTYIVKLEKSNNNLDDDLTYRNVRFKMHVFDGEKIENVFINDEPAKYINHHHKKDALPFNATGFSVDSKTLTFKFRQDIRKDYIIKIKIK